MKRTLYKSLKKSPKFKESSRSFKLCTFCIMGQLQNIYSKLNFSRQYPSPPSGPEGREAPD